MITSTVYPCDISLRTKGGKRQRKVYNTRAHHEKKKLKEFRKMEKKVNKLLDSAVTLVMISMNPVILELKKTRKKESSHVG